MPLSSGSTQETTGSFLIGFLLGVLLDPEDRGSTFLRNAGGLLLDYMKPACFLLGLLLNPENRGSTFLRNFGELLPEYATYYPRR
jgi:hypothetical protein